MESADNAWAILASVGPAEGLEIGPPDRVFDESDEVEKLSFLVTVALDENELGTQYGNRILDWADTQRLQPSFEIMVSLRNDFPKRPPELRVLRPLLEYGTGGVLNGYFAGIPALYPRGWDPHVGLPQVLSWARDCLRKLDAVPLDSGAFANVQAYRGTARRLMDSKPLGQEHAHKSAFKQQYTAFSSTWASLYMQAQIPDGFDSGGKVLLPSSALELLVRSELSDLGGRPQVQAGRGDALSMLRMSASPGDTSSSVTESAMVFELVGPRGAPVYAGVREFTSPEPGIIVLPPQLMVEAGLVEGAGVSVTRVVLPPITSVILQPHASSFVAVEETTGVPPREFLEASLANYSCLQPGTAVICDGGDPSASSCTVSWDEDGHVTVRPGMGAFRFNVIAVQPSQHLGQQVNAAALFVGFASQVNMEFLPAVDSYEVPAAPASAPGLLQPALQPSHTHGPMVPQGLSSAHEANDPAAAMLAAAGSMVALGPVEQPPAAGGGQTAAPAGGHTLGAAGVSGTGPASGMAALAQEREERRRKAAQAAQRAQQGGTS